MGEENVKSDEPMAPQPARDELKPQKTKPVLDPAPLPSKTLTVTRNQTPVRLNPDGQVICFVDSGQELTASASIELGEWTRVTMYVRTEDVK